MQNASLWIDFINVLCVKWRNDGKMMALQLQGQLRKIPCHQNNQKPSVVNKDECSFRISALQNVNEYVAYDDWP